MTGAFDAVHDRHLDVHEDDVGLFPGQKRQGFLAVGRLQHVVAEPLQGAAGGQAVDALVLDQQHGMVGRFEDHVPALPALVDHGQALAGVVRQGEGDGAVENAAPSRRALHPDLAAEHLRQVPGDGKAHARAADPLGQVVFGQLEVLENAALEFLGDADAGVADHEQQGAVIGGDGQAAGGDPFDAQLDGAFLRALEGVVQQVGQYLAQPERVAHELARDVRIEANGKAELLDLGPHGIAPGQGGDQMVHVKGRKHGFDGRRVDIGQLQHVVDDGEQALARGLDDVPQLPLVVLAVALERELGGADDAV